MPSLLSGTVNAIPSKSQAHRALICAALADKATFITCEGESEDIAATAGCLRALGAEIRRERGGYAVLPMKQRTDGGATAAGQRVAVGAAAGQREAGSAALAQRTDGGAVALPCGESGSTLRFLLPIVAALGQTAAFFPMGRLPQRPLSPMYEELLRHGCALSPQGAVPFHVSGKLMPGRYAIDAGVSSQFISGLLFALPLLDGDSELALTGRIESFPYIELTVAMLEAFGIKADFDGATFILQGGQSYRSPGTLLVEGDWSNAAFWLSAGAVGGSGVTCVGLDPLSRQGDRAILDILARFGAEVHSSADAVIVAGGALRGVEIDARDIPDLVPVLAVVAAAAEGTTLIRRAERLRDKESDRLFAITDVLGRLGADIRETEDGLAIRGGAALAGGRVSSHGDHRIAMAAAVCAALCEAPLVIGGAEAVGKSYPGFFDDMRALGGTALEVG